MSAVSLKSYNRQKPPADPESLVRYLDAELRKLQETITSLSLAIVQLQTKVNP